MLPSTYINATKRARNQNRLCTRKFPRQYTAFNLIIVRPMRAFIIAVLLIGTTSLGFAAEDITKYAQWITGDVFTKDDLLLFRADKAVQGNRTGDILLI